MTVSEQLLCTLYRPQDHRGSWCSTLLSVIMTKLEKKIQQMYPYFELRVKQQHFTIKKLQNYISENIISLINLPTLYC